MENSKKIKVGSLLIKVADSYEPNVSPDDKDMDKRVTAAVRAAINKANVCNKPVAKYNMRTQKAYIEQANGEKENVE